MSINAIIVWFRRLHWRLPITRTRFSGEAVGKVVILDYAEFKDATFRGCAVHYGGGPMRADGIRFIDGCTFSFFGSAANALKFMTIVNDCGGREVIEKTFQESTK